MTQKFQDNFKHQPVFKTMKCSSLSCRTLHMQDNSTFARRDPSCLFLFAMQEMDKTQGGIQQLLAAEQEAQSIVANARSAKMARLRQAKEEAEREVSAYRAQRESEYRKKLAESTGDAGTIAKRMEADTVNKIKSLQGEASRVSSDVSALLLKYVTTVRN